MFYYGVMVKYVFLTCKFCRTDLMVLVLLPVFLLVGFTFFLILVMLVSSLVNVLTHVNQASLDLI